MNSVVVATVISRVAIPLAFSVWASWLSPRSEITALKETTTETSFVQDIGILSVGHTEGYVDFSRELGRFRSTNETQTTGSRSRITNSEPSWEVRHIRNVLRIPSTQQHYILGSNARTKMFDRHNKIGVDVDVYSDGKETVDCGTLD